MASVVEFEDDSGQVFRYARHANGGGLVSVLAGVHEDASVAATAYVEAGATVGARTRIGTGSWLEHDVSVGQDVVVAGNVRIGPRTQVDDGAWIGTGARVGSGVVIQRRARIAPDAAVPDAAVVRRGAGRSELGIAA